MKLFSFHRASVGAKLAAVACGLVAMIIVAFAWALTGTAATQVGDEMLMRVTEKNQSLVAMITLFDKALTAEVSHSMSLFASFLPADYRLDVSQKVDINGVSAPAIKAGEKVLDMDFSIPDQFLAHSGAISTVFARNGDDFVRVTTSLKKPDGSRAIGTLLDHSAPAYAQLLNGKTFTGLAVLFGKHYITQYRPMTDASGMVVGALFVGVDVSEQIQSVLGQIRELKVGDTGYYFVLDASSGADRGKFLVHPAAPGRSPTTPTVRIDRCSRWGKESSTMLRPTLRLAKRQRSTSRCHSSRYRNGNG